MSNAVAQLRLAVLIDGDNISYRLADKLFAEVAKFGEAKVRRLYGDFCSPSAQGWKDAVHRHAIVSQQQFANAGSKNGTDISLVIDAMDLLYRGGVDGFCIVSSDSDYTPLATRIREHGLAVWGFGSSNAALSFRKACRLFVEIDSQMAALAKRPVAATSQVVPAKKAAKPTLPPPQMVRARALLLQAFHRLNGGEWRPLTDVLKEVRTVEPSFTARAYGWAKPITLVRKTACFDDELVGGTTMLRVRSAFPVEIAGTAAA